MSKLKSIINEVKEHAASLKDTIESEKVRYLNQKIGKLNDSVSVLLKENKHLRAVLVRVIEDIDRENKRNKSLLEKLNNV
jgi:flagellar biosynthesis/type III secretory pathway chaperone